MNKKSKPYDVTGTIMAYESGELDEDEIITLFQNLVNTGLAWQLQGAYGRTAAALIEAGEIFEPGMKKAIVKIFGVV